MNNSKLRKHVLSVEIGSDKKEISEGVIVGAAVGGTVVLLGAAVFLLIIIKKTTT